MTEEAGELGGFQELSDQQKEIYTQLIPTTTSQVIVPPPYVTYSEDLMKLLFILAWSNAKKATVKETKANVILNQTILWEDFVSTLHSLLTPLVSQNHAWLVEAIQLANKMTETKIKTLCRLYGGTLETRQTMRLHQQQIYPMLHNELATMFSIDQQLEEDMMPKKGKTGPSSNNKKDKKKLKHKNKVHYLSEWIDILCYEKANDYLAVIETIHEEVKLCTEQELVVFPA